MYKSLGTENKFLNSIWMWCQNNTRLILYMGAVKISEDINPRYIWFDGLVVTIICRLM